MNYALGRNGETDQYPALNVILLGPRWVYNLSLDGTDYALHSTATR